MFQFIQIKDERFRLSLIQSFEVLPENPFTPDTQSIQIKFGGKLIVIPFDRSDDRLWKSYQALQKLLPQFIQIQGTKFVKPALIKRYRITQRGVSINGGEYTGKNPDKLLKYLDKCLEKYEEDGEKEV